MNLKNCPFIIKLRYLKKKIKINVPLCAGGILLFRFSRYDSYRFDMEMRTHTLIKYILYYILCSNMWPVNDGRLTYYNSTYTQYVHARESRCAILMMVLTALCVSQQPRSERLLYRARARARAMIIMIIILRSRMRDRSVPYRAIRTSLHGKSTGITIASALFRRDIPFTLYVYCTVRLYDVYGTYGQRVFIYIYNIIT